MFSTVPPPPSDPKALTDELMDSLADTAAEVTPWFINQMPRAYFQDTDHETRLAHLRAIIAAKASGLPLRMILRHGTKVTCINERDRPGLLALLVKRLPPQASLLGAKVHTALDGKLVLDTFQLGEPELYDAEDPIQAEKRRLFVEYNEREGFDWTVEQIDEHLSRSAAVYVRTVTPLRFFRNLTLDSKVVGTDDTFLRLEPETDEADKSRLILAVGNADPLRMFERLAHHLGAHGVDIRRAHLDRFEKGGKTVLLITFVVHAPGGTAIEPKSALFQKLSASCLRLKWLDDRVIKLAEQLPELDYLMAEVLDALTSLVHQKLTPKDPHAYARDRIARLVLPNIELATRIAHLFRARFDPDGPMDDETFERATTEIRAAIQKHVHAEDAARIFGCLLSAVEHTFRTNVHCANRYGLALRLDPAYLARKSDPELPYGVFYVHGRGFDGYHVRFRDIARGGVRVVRTKSKQQYNLETERHYDEVYSLAHAQQLKNKDIPEGGSKAVILVPPNVKVAKAVKGFADGLLDLITPDPKTRARIVDRFGKDELLYLGPDENISVEMIDWVVDRAARRGYALPSSFMSSKPGAGINHKEYGVTSEGVTVFLEVALLSVGIDPRKQAFSVKLTGGPDGDVAGNEIRILHREYGENAKIVGIADGSGCAEDPDGLSHDELLRLVEASAPVADFDREKLGPRGTVTTVDTPAGVQARNTLHNRVRSDAFVPAGGRPSTIHGNNWRAYLDENDQPSSRVIVEGANLFITPTARQKLAEHGAIIVKDSSANKCGVICSSFEIAASMLVDTDTFMNVKEAFVSQVLERLRRLARAEAELLFREYARNPEVTLPKLSVRLSRVMNRTSDAITRALHSMSDEDARRTRDLVRSHLPAILVERAGSELFEQLPAAYLSRTIASSLAGKIIYREGLDYLEGVSNDAIGALALRYLEQERETARLMAEVQQAELPSRERIVELLRRAGTRAGLED